MNTLILLLAMAIILAAFWRHQQILENHCLEIERLERRIRDLEERAHR